MYPKPRCHVICLTPLHLLFNHFPRNKTLDIVVTQRSVENTFCTQCLSCDPD